MKAIIFALMLLCASAQAQTIDPLRDYRQTGKVVRNADGTIKRSGAVLKAFRKLYACPSTKEFIGSCPGWEIDHVIPLACGGADAIFNLSWLPNSIKSGSGTLSKDRWERRVYGGHGMSEGCP